jgi:aryl-alcohol dehydrogenase-like predicted oxidoreductase
MDSITGQARVTLGHSELSVRPIGLGCMGMSQSYGPADDGESIATLHAAVDLGVGLYDTSDIYGAADITQGIAIRGFGHNEELIGRAFAGRWHEVTIATKFGVQLDEAAKRVRLNGRPEYVAAACEASLRRLGVDAIDLYYLHRLDPKVPIEDTVGAMAALVAQGKVRAIGLSEVSADVLRRAHAVHPITALQSEYSLWERGVEAEIIPTCRELGVTLVPYSPLGRAALTGRLTTETALAEGDFRTNNPRFNADNLAHNLEPVAALNALAEAKQCQPGQLALAWLIAQPLEVVPIPGTKRVSYLTENMAATSVALSADEVAYLGGVFDPSVIQGDRYAPVHAANISKS